MRPAASARTARSTTRRACRDVTWVEPALVGQCRLREWTRDGRLRHPRYLGLREDKYPLKVVREEA